MRVMWGVLLLQPVTLYSNKENCAQDEMNTYLICYLTLHCWLQDKRIRSSEMNLPTQSLTAHELTVLWVTYNGLERMDAFASRKK